MTKITLRTSAGDFNFYADEHTPDSEIHRRLARRFGYRDVRKTNSSGRHDSFQLNMGTVSAGVLNVHRVVTVYK